MRVYIALCAVLLLFTCGKKNRFHRDTPSEPTPEGEQVGAPKPEAKPANADPKKSTTPKAPAPSPLPLPQNGHAGVRSAFNMVGNTIEFTKNLSGTGNNTLVAVANTTEVVAMRVVAGMPVKEVNEATGSVCTLYFKKPAEFKLEDRKEAIVINQWNRLKIKEVTNVDNPESLTEGFRAAYRFEDAEPVNGFALSSMRCSVPANRFAGSPNGETKDLLLQSDIDKILADLARIL